MLGIEPSSLLREEGIMLGIEPSYHGGPSHHPIYASFPPTVREPLPVHGLPGQPCHEHHCGVRRGDDSYSRYINETRLLTGGNVPLSPQNKPSSPGETAH